jgi:transitional endoplasmic reticulum ATPase
LLEICLSHRPVSPDVNLNELCTQLDGYSGADIKYICDRAATVPFLQSVASGEEGQITRQILQDALADTQRSVGADVLKRFDEWSGATARA